MKLTIALIASLFALSSATTIDVGIVPVGKELDFIYEAIVHAGTKQPAVYESEYKIKATIHLQGLKPDLIGVKLTDVVYNLNNGEVKLEQILKTTYLPIPTEAELLKIPFQIQYDGNGKIVALILDQADKEWSINIKQSIASLLQINRQVIDTERRTGYFSVVPEETVYGLCDVQYEIIPHDDSYILIKSQEPAKCKNHMDLVRHSSILSVASNRVYKLTNKDNHLHIESLEAKGDLLVFNPAVNGLTDYVHTIQTLKFVEEGAIANEIQINNKVIVKSLMYNEPRTKCRDMPLNNIYDITNGRRVLSTETEIKHVDDLLDELVNYIDAQHITFKQPEIKNVQLVARISRILETFNLPALEQCFALLQEKSTVTPRELKKLNLFVQMLPHVGTRAAVVLIRNLIRKQKIEDYVAIRIVRDLPNHIQCPNEKLLTELEDLLTMGEENSMLRSTSILSYATLVRKTYENIDEKSAVFEQYITRFVNQFKTAQDYKTKIIYLEALSNIGIGSVLKYLEPIIRGEEVVEGNIRSLAVLAAAPRLVKDPYLMMKMILPILSDYRLDTDLRVTAYYVYVKTEQPTLARFMKLYWLLKEDPNGKLYNFHYNTLVAFAKTTNFEKSNLRDICRILLRISHRPINVIPTEGFHIHEYYDFENKFGARAESFLIQTNRGITLKSKIRTKYAGYDFDFLTVYMRLVDQHKNVIPVEGRSERLNHQNILSDKKYSVELIIRRADRTQLIIIENNVNIMQLFKTLAQLDFIQTDGAQNKINLNVPIYYDLILPTDLGVPVRLTESYPVIHLIKFNFDTNGVMKMDLRFKGIGCRTMQTKVYNPIVDLWHGVQAVRSIALNLPLNLIMEKSQGWGFKVTMKKVTTDDIIGLQDYVLSEVFIHGYQNQQLLSNFRQDVSIYETVTRGNSYRKDVVIHKVKLDGIGKNLEVVIFDCDRDVSRGTLLTKIKEAERRRDLNDISLPLELVRLQQYLLLSPETGSCGMGLRLLPLENTDHAELGVEILNENMKQEDHLYFPALKINVRTYFVAKSVQNTDICRYDAEVLLDLTELQRKLVFNLLTSKKELGVEKYKMDVKIQGKLNVDTLDLVTKITLGDVNKLGVVDVVIKGFYSEEQERIHKEKDIIYNECRNEFIGRNEILPVSYECVRTAVTLRKYIIDISVNNKENEWVKNILSILQNWRIRFRDFVEHQEVSENIIDAGHEDHLHLEVVFPAFRNEWDVQVKTSKGVEVFKGIPRRWDDAFLRLIHPTDLSSLNVMVNTFGRSYRNIKTCIVGAKHIMTDQSHILNNIIPTEWTPYIRGLTSEGEAYTVFLKKVDGDRPIALRLKVQDEVLEVVPGGVDGTITYNGQVITKTWAKYTELSKTLQYFLMPHPKTAIIRSNLYGVHIIFDGRVVRIYSPASLVQRLEGKCTEY